MLKIPDALKTGHLDNKSIDLVNLKLYNKDLKEPTCEVHCFSSAKKFNSAIVTRRLPPDTYVRLWLFDLSPAPFGFINHENRACGEYQIVVNIHNKPIANSNIELQKSNSICVFDFFPTNLNTKHYLGDSGYIMKWGFHIASEFRIDHALENANQIDSKFTIEDMHMFRFVLFSFRIEVDLQLFVHDGSELKLITESQAKMFEDAIIIELAPGTYTLRLKTFPESDGYHECESIKVEFAMHRLTLLNENLEAQSKLTETKIELDSIIKDQKAMTHKLQRMAKFNVKVKKPFVIGKDPLESYMPTEELTSFTFVIEPKMAEALEMFVEISSNFVILDCAAYLTENRTGKTITSVHYKNFNSLKTNKLATGNYTFSLRYYRILHFNNAKQQVESTSLKHSIRQFEISISFINHSANDIKLPTTIGEYNILSKVSHDLSYEFLCRHISPIPKSLNSLRFTEFTSLFHVIDDYLLPANLPATETIEFTVNETKHTFRAYIESKGIEAYLKLYFENSLIEETNTKSDFITLMSLLKKVGTYKLEISFLDNSSMAYAQECKTFRLEMSIEKNHNYACPVDNNKYKKLTDIHIVPSVLPLADHRKFNYDSRTIFLGDNNNSGYLFMPREDKNKVMKFADFEAQDEIDIKFMLLYDFGQTPISIKLLHQTNTYSDKEIVAEGTIYENMNVFLRKNLPKGKYSFFIFIPKMSTKFINEPVCSIYDIVFEGKRSTNYYNNVKLLDVLRISEEHLDIPTYIPSSLNNIQYLETTKNLNLLDYFLLKDAANVINFTLNEESIVRFEIYSNFYENINLSLDDGKLGRSVSSLLTPGNHKVSVTVDNFNKEKNAVLLHLGISPLSRIIDIMSYNNFSNIDRECINISLPASLDIKDKVQFYKNELITYKINDISNRNLGSIDFKVDHDSYVVAEISSDFLIHKVKLQLTSTKNTYSSIYNGNTSEIESYISPGNYSIKITYENDFSDSRIKCLLYGFKIAIMPVSQLRTNENIINNGKMFALGIDNNFIQSRLCTEGRILPAYFDPSENKFNEFNRSCVA